MQFSLSWSISDPYFYYIYDASMLWRQTPSHFVMCAQWYRKFDRTATTAAAATAASIDDFIYSLLLSTVHIHIILFDVMHFESLSDYVFNVRISVNWISHLSKMRHGISHAIAKFFVREKLNETNLIYHHKSIECIKWAKVSHYTLIRVLFAIQRIQNQLNWFYLYYYKGLQGSLKVLIEISHKNHVGSTIVESSVIDLLAEIHNPYIEPYGVSCAVKNAENFLSTAR